MRDSHLAEKPGPDRRQKSRREEDKKLKAGEACYRALFEDSLVSLWEEDFSQVKAFVDSLRKSGVTDFRAHFATHPEELQRAVALVKVLNVNQTTLELFGATDQPQFLSSLKQIFRTESYEIFREELIALTEGQRTFKGELTSRTLAGKKTYLALGLVVVPGCEETWERVFVSIVDVTDRKLAEERLTQANRALEEGVAKLAAANRELDAFSYSVSHDLRAPLRAIDGFAKALLEMGGEKVEAAAKELLQRIWDNAQKMGQLIEDLLAFSRMGRVEMKPAKIDMQGLAQKVYEELKLLAPDRNIQFNLDGLPPLQGDPALIRQVLVNLLSNAVKYTKKKEQAVIDVGWKNGDDGQVIYYVKDNGAGFDMKYAHKLFGVFQRLHSQEEFEGTGVGLSLVQRIIARHGGRVWAEAKVGEGATFYFTLPKP